MKHVSVRDAVGMVLCHDVTRIVPGEYKGPAFKKGHIIGLPGCVMYHRAQHLRPDRAAPPCGRDRHPGGCNRTGSRRVLLRLRNMHLSTLRVRQIEARNETEQVTT